MIRNVIFDFGKVLIDYDFSLMVNRYFADADEGGEFVRIFSEPRFIEKCDLELVPFSEIIADAKCQYPRFADALQWFSDHYADFSTGEIPGMRSLLGQLKAKGYKLYGLTNWCSKVHEIIPLYGIFSLLDGYLISAEEHLIKPDSAIYLRLCEKFGLMPSECLFTDDKSENIAGAESVGMKGILFRNAEDFASQLERWIELS